MIEESVPATVPKVLNQTQCEAYDAVGFLLLDGLLDSDAITELVSVTEDFVA